MALSKLALVSLLSLVFASPAPQSSSASSTEFPGTHLDDSNIDGYLKDALAQQTSQQRTTAGAFADYLATFAFSKTVVTKNTNKDVSYDLKGPNNCKVFPGDKAWPSNALWTGLKLATLGGVEHHAPLASVCYQGNGTYNEARCQELTATWNQTVTILPHPIEVMSPTYEGLSCQPPELWDDGDDLCTQGGYPVYTLTAEHPAQIQLAVNFARNTGIRLVVKNTGHDFLGRAAGAGSLSVWTHNLKDMEFIPKYSGPGDYKGAAIKAGAGVEGRDLHTFGHKYGVIMVGGICVTVGTLGGYAQGGGHSPLSPLHGLGADQILSFEAVTSDGRLVTASPSENADLYWAMRGGGSGDYAIWTSATIKAHPEEPKGYTAAQWTFAVQNIAENDAFKQAVRSWFSYFPENADKGVYSYANIIPTPDGGALFIMIPYIAAGTTMEEGKAILQPWFDEVEELGIDVGEVAWAHYDSYYDVVQEQHTYGSANAYGGVTGNRLFPRSNWETETSFNETFEAIWQSLLDGEIVLPYNLQPAKIGNSAAHPAWYDSIAYVITGAGADYTQNDETINESRYNFTNGAMQRWRDVSPNGGSYMNEGDRLEPNFQWNFYGDNYPKLLDIKKKFDPFNLFYAAVTPGSEFFEVRSIDGVQNENGRLCKNPNPELYQPGP